MSLSHQHSNSLVSEVPVYLLPFIAKQDPSLYTAMDHASWRFILKISHRFFAEHAHQKYLDGLKETGISAERIPLIEEMDQCLREFGWRAVPVTGFIPPAVFMEFLSLGILPIACDMRTLEHLAYTPAPDIVHEAAGHAPIIADAEYASYLKSYGEISRKAIFSQKDTDVYQAIRLLSDIKENPHSGPQDISVAQARLEQALASITYDSEATLLSRMGWWTFEYGLIGNLSNPKIYGAGLLSSVGESYHCLSSDVKKIPFSIDCIHTSYDITRPQPQLFVTPDFQTLKVALEELADTMAFRKGGMEGLEKAKESKTTTTTELETGIQVSGCLVNFICNPLNGAPCYLQFQGPTQISYRDQEIEGQGADYHHGGFGTPIESISAAQLEEAGLIEGSWGKLRFSSGVAVEGRLLKVIQREGRPVLLTFENCTVTRGSDFLFRPEWGNYDMVCGEKVVSVFGGVADRTPYLKVTGGFKQEPGQQKSNLTAPNKGLNQLYAQVRKIREDAIGSPETFNKLGEICKKLDESYRDDWLLRYELLELSQKAPEKCDWLSSIQKRLEEISTLVPERAELIRRGIEAL